MKYRMVMVVILAIGTLACGTDSVITPNQPASGVRSYTGSASVGDFFSISLDPVAQTLTYTNHSNNDSGVVAYTENPDGTYAISDPNGNLQAAFEIPNYALLVQAAKTGPNHNVLSLVTAVETSQVTAATFANQKYNYMQFRTAAGGLEIGSVTMDAQTNFTLSSYWPLGEQSQARAFSSSAISATGFQEDPSGTFLQSIAEGSQTDSLFGTPSGIFAVDTHNGAIFGLQQAATKAFNPNYAATYKAMYYQKLGASNGMNDTEGGTPSMGIASLVIGATGQVTLQDSQSNVLAQGILAAVADTPYLVGSDELQDPCFGLFTFRATTANSQQDFFMTFLNQAVLFSSYTNLTSAPGNYNYFYGVALK